jgi:hypothetical protein
MTGLAKKNRSKLRDILDNILNGQIKAEASFGEFNPRDSNLCV